MRCWILSDGQKIGSHNQGLGLALALGFNPELKKIYPRFPWSILPPRLWFRPLAAQKPTGNLLAPPWPDLLIACGRAAAAPARAIRKLSGCFTICLMNPKVPLDAFDLFIVPEHDRLKGPNVLSILGPVHMITQESLKSAAQQLAPSLGRLPRPFTAVLLGGHSPHCHYSQDVQHKLVEKIVKTACRGGTLLITPSRRTPPELIQLLKQQLTGFPYKIWDGEPPNPYQGYLGIADQILVTSDSINMSAEACYTGKPVYILDIPLNTKKFDSYFQRLIEGQHARYFEDGAPFKPHQLNEMDRLIPQVKSFLAKAGLDVDGFAGQQQQT